MAPKRKSDAVDALESFGFSGGQENADAAPKRARVSEAGDAVPVEASSSKGKKKAKEPEEPKKWQDIVLEGEAEGDVPIYDDCNEIRRKIRLLQKEPGFKVTHWLKEIGGINNNSFGRFMKATGPSGGASNGTYEAAYIYFEKRRIAEGKKKTPKRIRNEETRANGLPKEQPRADTDDTHEQWSDAPETFENDGADGQIEEIEQGGNITLKHQNFATADDTKTADAPGLDTTVVGPSPLTGSPTDRAYDNATPAPYALIRRVSFKSVVVMEHRGVLVAIAGRRDGVRVYALEEVKKAVEWRLDVEVRRQRDRQRREEAKRSHTQGSMEKPSVEKLPPSASSSASTKTGRRSSLASGMSIANSKSPSKTKSPARSASQPIPQPALSQPPSMPPPSYNNAPPMQQLRTQSSLLSINRTRNRTRSGSVTNVLSGTITRRNTDATILGQDRDVRDPDAKNDWMNGHVSDEEAIDVVAAAGARVVQFLDVGHTHAAESTACTFSIHCFPAISGRVDTYFHSAIFCKGFLGPFDNPFAARTAFRSPNAHCFFTWQDGGGVLNLNRTEPLEPGGWKFSGTPTVQPAPAPKLEYVKLPGTKGSLMIKAVETSKKSFLAILCGDNGEKVELFAGTYRTALGLSRTFILPDSPRSLELQLQGDDLVEVFLMFSQNVFGLEPATVRVREVRIGRAERRAARRRARELRAVDESVQGEPDTAASEEGTNVNVSIGVSVSSSTTTTTTTISADGAPGGITATSSQAPSETVTSVETPHSAVVSPTEELVALATAQMGPYTTFQQLSFAPNFPLAAIADDYIIPPTYPDFLQYRTEHEPEVNGNSDVDLAQVQFSPPGLPQPIPMPPSRWFYRDPKGIVHGAYPGTDGPPASFLHQSSSGPWKTSLMQAWYRDGLLPPDLPVRREEDDEYVVLKDLRQHCVDPTQPFGLSTTTKAFAAETVPITSDGKPLLSPISLLTQPKIFGPPALFYSSRGGHSTVIVDGRGRSVLKGRLMWSSDDQEDEAVSARLGDVKRLEAFDVEDRSVLVAMRQGGLEAVDLSDALLRPADASRTALPHYNPSHSQINRRAPFIWRIGMPVSSPSSAPTALALSKPSQGRALGHKKNASHPAKSHGRAELSGGADADSDPIRDEVIFLGRQQDNIYLCERNAGAFRILRLCPTNRV
ncbi:hypothetical protein EWM64_g609 [Hericium alpestre]|uniref:Uncharacterized protein n=1 Tax=Hericium alpestre TaxID=135208 RepID=A0A4Z0A8J3_9AGAM|nr:hypothetical protein EWM64_g609 [Hericium alpestre]